MNISILSVQNLQKIFATIAVFAMVFSPFSNVPVALAAESASLKQAENGAVGGPVVSPVTWATGNVNQAKGHYVEGQSIPYRMLMEGLTPNVQSTLVIEFDVTKSGKFAIDYITSNDRISETVNPCSDIPLVCSGAPTTSDIPAPAHTGTLGTFTGTNVAASFNAIDTTSNQVMKMWNGTIGSITYSTQANISQADSSARVTILFTPTSDKAVISWGGHISSGADYPNLSAVTVPGSPYHTRLIGLNGAGGNQDRSLSASAVPPSGFVNVIKHVINDNGETGVASDFTINATSNTSAVPASFQGSETGVSVAIPAVNANTAATYSFTEVVSGDYDVTYSADCSGTIASGVTKTCTITNNDKPAPAANLTLIKNVSGGTAPASTWTLTADGAVTDLSGTSGISGQVNPGTYTLSESPAVALYTPSDWQCTGATVTNGNQITLANGDSATCTITNTYTPTNGTLTVTKTIGDLFGAQFGFPSFSFSIGNDTPVAFNQSGSNEVSLLAGVYSVVETAVAGFLAPVYGGDCATGSVTIVAGGSKTCTITNTGIQPKLTLTKVVTNDEPERYRGTAQVADFALFAGAEQFVSGVQEGINVGTYALSETGPTSGYNASYACVKNGGATTTDASITLALGDVASCTITNDDKDPTTSLVTFTKTVVGGYNLPDQLPSAFSFDVVGGSINENVAHAGSLELGVGTYAVTEVGPTAGYATTFGGACAGGTLTVASGDLGGPLSCTITNTELPACSNFINDDGREDALVDSNDPGCTGPTDDDETDPVATITIDKVVVGEGASVSEAFTFETWLAENILLSAEGAPVSFTGLKPGQYTFSEINLPSSRWAVESISCTDATGPENDLDDNVLNSATVNVSLGEHITCVVTNRYTPRDSGGNNEYIVVQKEVTAGSDTTEAFDFVINGSNEYRREFQLAHGQSNGSSIELNADESYSVSESVPEGWNKPSVSCVSSQDVEREISASEFTLRDGETVTCTFTNDQEAPVCEIGDNLLLNASFEDPVADANLFGSGAWEIFDTVANWASSVNEIELWNNMFGGASEGEQNVELDGNGGGATTISQSVATIPGAIYELRFDFSARPDTGLVDNNVDALVEGTVLMNASADGSELSGNTWTTYSDTFEATDASTEIAFADKGEQNGLGSLVDNAVLCLVRAPETPNYSQGSYGGGGGSSSGSRRKRPVDTPVPQVLGEATSTMPVGAPNTGAGGSSDTAVFPSLVLASTATRNTLRKSK